MAAFSIPAKRQPIIAVAAMMGESRSSFARKTGIPRQEVTRVWGGSEAPNERHVAIAIKFFGVSEDDLFRRERAPIGPRGGGTVRRRGGAR